MEESEIEVIIIKSSDDKSMEEINGEVVQEELRDVQMNKDYQGVKSTRASDSFDEG
ncbi:PREDICTED: LOC110762218, partial [Prunus dulcis]